MPYPRWRLSRCGPGAGWCCGDLPARWWRGALGNAAVGAGWCGPQGVLTAAIRHPPRSRRRQPTKDRAGFLLAKPVLRSRSAPAPPRVGLREPARPTGAMPSSTSRAGPGTRQVATEPARQPSPSQRMGPPWQTTTRPALPAVQAPTSAKGWSAKPPAAPCGADGGRLPGTAKALARATGTPRKMPPAP